MSVHSQSQQLQVPGDASHAPTRRGLISHRVALLHVASCPSCMRQLVRVLQEIADDPPTYARYIATHAHSLDREQFGDGHRKSGIELEADLGGISGES